MSAVDERGAEVTCGATAEYCVCVKPAGHVLAGDPVHGCNPAECTAEWTGDYPTKWQAVTLPMAVTP